MRIGIFGGSFDPVHEGHIRLAEEAASELCLDRIYFVPLFQNPLENKEKLLPDAARVRLLRAAVKHHPGFFISLCEIQRKGSSFTVDTLKYFKKKFGKKDMLYFLCGADVLPRLEHWKSIDEIFKLCRFVVMTRPGYRFIKTKRPVLCLPFSALDVSSSELRKRVKRRQAIRGLVSPKIESMMKKYFKQNNGGLKSNRIKKLI